MAGYDFAETPQLYDVFPLYDGYMKFAKEEYLRGNRLFFASPFIDAKTVLSLVMNTGGRDLIKEHEEDLKLMYKEYLKKLFDEDEVANVFKEPVLFTRLKSYNTDVIPEKKDDKDPETKKVSDEIRKVCRKALRQILGQHFDLRLQPQKQWDGPPVQYFHCKWAASERLDRKKCKVLLTTANLTTEHMQREKPTNGYSQCDMAYFVSMDEDDFREDFLKQLEEICK